MPIVKSPRLKHWGLLTLFSAIFLRTACKRFDSEQRNSDINFAICTSAITVIFGPLFICSLKYAEYNEKLNIVTRGLFELVASACLLFCWCIVVGILEKHNITFDANGLILDANLYYFSWLSLVSAVMLFFHNTSGFFNNEKTGDKTRFILWVSIFTSNIVLMSSSIPDDGFFDGCAYDDVDYCKRLFFGAMLGACTAIVSFIILLAYHRNLDINKYCQVELVFSLLIAICYIFGVFAITTDGPGSMIGNIYYSAWISFILTITLVIDCFHEIDNESIKKRFGKGSPKKLETADKNVESPVKVEKQEA